jgi:Flp pilus assembly protein TadD
MKHWRAPLLIALSMLALSGCDHFHGKTAQAKGDGAASKDKVAGAIASAAADAANEGNTADALAFQQKLYNGDPRNPDYILSYARALRHAGRIDDALLVVRTPAKGPRATEPLMTECAMVLIAGGQYEEALDFAQKALEKDDDSAGAHQALALALSGLNKNADAELQFRRSLELWPEDADKTPIINNLAMSMAAQGKISEARKVMAMATGEALKSATYQNNRAMLDSLKDRDIVGQKLTVQSTAEITSQAPAAGAAKLPNAGARMAPVISSPSKVQPRAKMKPIVEYSDKKYSSLFMAH